MIQRLFTLLLVFGALFGLIAGGALLVSASGVIPIAASSGHFAITEWFLQFSKQRSVATHTLGLELPNLDDPTLVLKGAGHYESACRPCHGSPELREPRVARAMLPPPPYLADRIANWEPEELFYIVKHGIKFTGMPAWPAPQRDDEVQAVVAFLLKLPKFDVAAYRQLVHGEVTPRAGDAPIAELATEAPALSATCARCHGKDGRGRELGAFPRIAGQRREYLQNALDAYARDRRSSGTMQPIAAALSQGERRELVDYYAQQSAAWRSEIDREDKDAIARGQAIARRGIPEQRVPTCASCHGPDPDRKNPAYPLLAGQFAEYLVVQLELFQRGARGGSSYHHLMHKVVMQLRPEQMRDVAAYYASLSGPDSSTLSVR